MQKSFGKLVWVNSIKSLINDNYLNIITDLRFEHEYDFCINNKFKIIKVNNLNNTLNVNNIAENYYSLFKENYVFYNYISDDIKFKIEFKKLIEFIENEK